MPQDLVNASSFAIFVEQKLLNLVDLEKFCIVGRAYRRFIFLELAPPP